MQMQMQMQRQSQKQGACGGRQWRRRFLLPAAGARSLPGSAPPCLRCVRKSLFFLVG